MTNKDKKWKNPVFENVRQVSDYYNLCINKLKDDSETLTRAEVNKLCYGVLFLFRKIDSLKELLIEDEKRITEILKEMDSIRSIH